MRQENSRKHREGSANEGSLQAPITIAILGASIGGLALAIGLAKRNVPVTVYEAAEQFSTVGAGIGLGPNSLSTMDLIDPIFQEQYEKVKTKNEKPEFEHSMFDALYAKRASAKSGAVLAVLSEPLFHS
ncbi:hypothetical protein F4820DRAFT_407584 [Hypoxylon rubiginosum]|uniref:Uncharacterized protein n=1 Tax=Hypoxylon rubiginosum TaxID=110542 RepID=A0ACB9ZBH6_9PEZI|nr:hypothetical protein F4820DRAFT_407584 [Hypoxylon rubiginosum]